MADKGALRLVALNGAAAALGLAPGLALADARARFPDLLVSEAEPEAEARLLARFADACERYTPLLALDGPEGLLLDVTGCAHLFGDEAGLVRDLLRRVGGQGFAARAALASTAGAAFALARFSGRGERRAGAGVVVPEEEALAPLLAPLPLAALRLEAATLGALVRLGFGTVGDLIGKPRAPLAARFGAGLLERLDAALGTAPAAVDYRFAPPVFCAERNLFEPVERVEDVLGLTVKLAATLETALERHGVGARRLDLALFRVDGEVTRLMVGTGRPLRAPEAIRRLFAEKIAALTSLDPGFGFDLLRLAVREAAPMAEHQSGFAAATDGAEALDGLIDRLSIRFGARQVQVLRMEDRHWPDSASHAVPAQGLCASSLMAAATEVAGAGAMPLAAAWPLVEALDPPPASPAVRPGGAPAPAVSPAAFRLMPRAGAVALTGGAGWGSGPARALKAVPASRSPMARLSPAEGEGGAPARSVATAFASSPPGEAGEGGHGPVGAAEPGARPGGRPLAGGSAAATLLFDAARAGLDVPRPSEAGRGARRPALPVAGARAHGSGPDTCGPERPLRLFETPEPVEAVAEVPDGPPVQFRWRRRLHEVARVEGPERIAAEWWRRGPDAPLVPTRDYFRVETREGHRFWLFRAGLYGREAGAPRWFLHGLFG